MGKCRVSFANPSPLKGDISLAGAFPFAGVSGSAPMRIIVVVVVVVSITVVSINT